MGLWFTKKASDESKSPIVGLVNSRHAAADASSEHDLTAAASSKPDLAAASDLVLVFAVEVATDYSDIKGEV